MGEKEGEGYVIKPDLNPEISSFPRLGCFDALFREGEGRDIARYTRFSHPPEKIPPSSPSSPTTTRNKSRGDGRGKNLETRTETDNNKQTKREREKENINK